jgi:rubrerythrin
MTDGPTTATGGTGGEAQGPAAPYLFEESSWVQRLFTHLTDHVQNERGLLQAYAEAAEATESRAFAYLVKLLIEDEQRHHRLFAEMAASLKSEAEMQPAEPIIPRMDFDRVDPAPLREATGRLLENEKKDREELKQLRRELRFFEDRTLWTLLVDLMQRDTDKHIAIIGFAQRHANRRRRRA